jgi:hypothetical protein
MPQTPPTADAMTPTSTPLDTVTRLGELVPFRVDDVARSIGLRLVEQPTGSNPYFTIYKSDAEGAGLFRGAELRVRNTPAPGRDGLLIVDLAPDSCVTQEEAIEKLGSPRLSPASPHAPPTAPHYYVYDRPWGQLRLGFSRDEKACLVTVVFDATGS